MSNSKVTLASTSPTLSKNAVAAVPSFRQLYSAQQIEQAAKEASRAVSGGRKSSSQPQLGVPVEKTFRGNSASYALPSKGGVNGKPPMTSSGAPVYSSGGGSAPAAPGGSVGPSQGGGSASYDLPGTNDDGDYAIPSYAHPGAVPMNDEFNPKSLTPITLVPKQPVKTASLWDRFLAWIGLQRKPAVMAGEQEMTQEQGVASVVNRARCGDQNAMAIIALVRDNAVKGNPRAARSLELIKKYCHDNPPSDDFAGDVDCTDCAKNVSKMVSCFGAEEQLAFAHGMLDRPVELLPPDLRRAAALGRAIAKSKASQYLKAVSG